MSVPPIKVGVIGAGDNTRVRHIPGLQAIEGVEIVSVCNRSRESSQRVADAMGIPQVYDDWRALIASDEINAVMIGTWPYMHCEMTCAALEAGKHVMCEARMAMNAAEAHTMLRASQSHPDLVAQIVKVERFPILSAAFRIFGVEQLLRLDIRHRAAGVDNRFGYLS